MSFSRTTLLGSCLGLGLIAGCGPAPAPENIGPVRSGGAYQAQYRDPPAKSEAEPMLLSPRLNAQKCRPAARAGGKGGSLVAAGLRGERLSRNDLVDVRVADDETFNGDYVVSRDGALKLPFLPSIRAQGRSPEDIEAELARLLVREGFYDEAPRISVRLADYASVNVAVSGAVFEPHAIEIGTRVADDIDRARQDALGASTEARNLSAALRSVGGVRPDADLSAVELHRGGRKHVLDMRGVFEGRNAVDVMLLTGDEIVVPSRQCFQDDLMRPGPISPPGVSLFLSNLTQPASNNASSAVGRDVREVAYGTRFMQAVVDTNCVGGARATSAHRSAVLFTRDPITGISTVIERNIEDMLRRADRDDYDPYLLPGDSIACYDSQLTNLAEVAGLLGTVAAAGAILP
ncbi:polysaccharide biosynthesis/export family protein [Rhodalgimonas zhirmunskyi]|uniref:Polysaccharide biosynthesis/export family protein n=1 Tax=Rhodalgimonas zhirmunskyi TaxID=2964767 RepID=A0AAJ1U7P2_9RHOB|nr:polysaccharide biosynthesis/export family protein [Rhodoalgimonas zhirmunskyi]MDQ2094936.1 polysaccharide biosynthesis/export family protein [Rhodoalgimonas zhirmunskyi]